MPVPCGHDPMVPDICLVCKRYLTEPRWRRSWDKAPKPVKSAEAGGLGTMLESALTAVGITSDRVSKWLGRPCNCKERKEKLNAIGAWAKRILSGKTEDAEKHLESIIKERI